MQLYWISQSFVFMMSSQEIEVILVVVIALVLILSNRMRVDLVAMLVLLTLALTGVVTPQEALSGFGSSVVITLTALFIVTRALEETGVTQWIGQRMSALGKGSEMRLILLFMGVGAAMTLTMNIVAAGAFLLPAAVQVARQSRVRTSKLLIPLAFGTLAGGTATYFASANVILSSILQENRLEGLSIVDFLPTGSLIVIASMLFMAFIGRRLLPERDSAVTELGQIGGANLFETYQLEERLWEVRVPAGSRLENRMLSETGIGSDLGVSVLAIWRDHHAILAPPPHECIQTDDYLLVLGREERVAGLKDWGVAFGRSNGVVRADHDYSVELTEVVIPPRSTVIGKTLKDLNFRNKYGLTSVALWREGRSFRTDVGLFPLQVGDALLMVGPAKKIRTLAAERDFMVLQSESSYAPSAPDKAKWVLLIVALALAAAFLEIVSIPIAMLAGVVAIIMTRAISMDEAYRAVGWQVIFLVAGMIPLSVAMINTGLAHRLSEFFINQLLPFGPLALIGGMFALTVLLVQVMGGQVTALVIGPVTIAAALQAGIDPQAMAVATATACSTAFLTPIAHPVNILMMGPGGYKPSDFTKVGAGMTIVVTVMLLIGMMVFWHIR